MLPDAPPDYFCIFLYMFLYNTATTSAVLQEIFFFFTVLVTSLGPSPQSSTQCQQTFPCCTVCLVWLALGASEISNVPYYQHYTSHTLLSTLYYLYHTSNIILAAPYCNIILAIPYWQHYTSHTPLATLYEPHHTTNIILAIPYCQHYTSYTILSTLC